ncbi:SHOCT domain-containing protein [Desulfitibacter alkalitolerans]|uniref:SHOCT domain-containing protein n=1 Tax=Desulfitibacter alkalitolerans TaxID=264641 RepID=UPI000686E2F7|nr:SHOCT domain-containing protein [Desulfitibacter alkalitolerans]
MMPMFGYGFGSGWLWMAAHMLFWVFLIVGIVLLVNKITTKEDKSSAFRILDEKLASGEITEAEYKHKRKILKGS